MENINIILDNGLQVSVNGIFYVFNLKYYFIYTMRELDENGYVKLYVVQVGKETQNTPNGPVDTGYMLGMEISDIEEWKTVQKSITQIVEDKKNSTQSSEIQYLPISMLVNLKIVSTNKFKLMKNVIEDNFKIMISQSVLDNTSINEKEDNTINLISGNSVDDVIIDYRSRFFEEQEKNNEE